MPPEPPRGPRLQTATDRDISGIAAKRERESRQNGVVEAAATFDDITNTTEIGSQQRRDRRRERDPLTRLDLLEEKHDRLADSHEKLDGKVDKIGDVVVKMRVDVGKMSGKLDVLPDLVDAVKAINKEERKNMRDWRKLAFRFLGVVVAVLGGAFAHWLLSGPKAH